MSSEHFVKLTCDRCGAESNSVFGWARIHISGSTKEVILSPDQNYDLCSQCWLTIRQKIFEYRKSVVKTDAE